MEAHEPYHRLPVSEWDRVAAELQEEERRSGRANYAAVPPARPWVVEDVAGQRREQPPTATGSRPKNDRGSLSKPSSKPADLI